MATPVQEPLEAKKQWWFRQPDSKARKLAEKIVVHREAGRDDRQIAKILKTTEQTVRQTVYLARKNGWLDANDEPIDVEAEIALNLSRKVVRNLDAALDGQMTNWQTHEINLAAAKGFGIFKNYDVKEGNTEAPNMVIGVQVVMPAIGAGDQKMDIPDNMIGGVPAYVEGEVVDDGTRGVESGFSAAGALGESAPETRS